MYNLPRDSLATVATDANDIIQDGRHVIMKEQRKRKSRDNIFLLAGQRGGAMTSSKKNSEKIFFFKIFFSSNSCKYAIKKFSIFVGKIFGFPYLAIFSHF